MTDLQGNELNVGDIVYCCVNGRSKRLVKTRVMEIAPSGNKCNLGSRNNMGYVFTNKTRATIVKAFNQEDSFDE